jgi:hypothetical protein
MKMLMHFFVQQATKCLVKAVEGIAGAFVENNKFCVSVHYRNVDEKVAKFQCCFALAISETLTDILTCLCLQEVKLVEDTVNDVLGGFPDLRLEHGKKVRIFSWPAINSKSCWLNSSHGAICIFAGLRASFQGEIHQRGRGGSSLPVSSSTPEHGQL